MAPETPTTGTPLDLGSTLLQNGPWGAVCLVLIWLIVWQARSHREERKEFQTTLTAIMAEWRASAAEMTNKYEELTERAVTIWTSVQTLLSERLPRHRDNESRG